MGVPVSSGESRDRRETSPKRARKWNRGSTQETGAHDMYTATGKRMGRGVEHFRTEGTKLVPAPEGKDPFEDEAYRLWALKREVPKGAAAGKLFEEE